MRHVSQASGALLRRGRCAISGKMCLETIEAVGPFGMRATEPVVHREQPLELQSRRTALAVAGSTDQTRLLQHLQMLCDRGLN